jgi:hypothetical protein
LDKQPEVPVVVAQGGRNDGGCIGRILTWAMPHVDDDTGSAAYSEVQDARLFDCYTCRQRRPGACPLSDSTSNSSSSAAGWRLASTNVTFASIFDLPNPKPIKSRFQRFPVSVAISTLSTTLAGTSGTAPTGAGKATASIE